MAKDKGEDLMELGPTLPCLSARPFVRKRSPEHGPEFGVVTPVRNGQPIDSATVHLEHQGPGEVYRVSPALEGPSKVATDEYRTGWDRIFGTKAAVGQA